MLLINIFFLGNFMGDIAVPDVEYSNKKEKDRQVYAEKIEKYKKEINEGLQIEEEGIVQGMSKSIDVAQIKIRHRHNNRTRKNHFNRRKNDDHQDKTTVLDNSLSRYLSKQGAYAIFYVLWILILYRKKKQNISLKE